MGGFLNNRVCSYSMFFVKFVVFLCVFNFVSIFEVHCRFCSGQFEVFYKCF